MVVIDRQGMALDAVTATLAHELGHLLLDDPYHPTGARVAALRVMARDSGRPELPGRRFFVREECARMRANATRLRTDDE